MKVLENLKTTLPYLPARVRQALAVVPEEKLAALQEIRLRSGKPVCLTLGGETVCLTASGELKQEGALRVSREEIVRSFQAVCSYSVYSHEKDVAEGYVTIRGGCRVGIGGTAVRKGDAVQSLKNVGSLNFRIAGEFHGAAEAVWRQIGAAEPGVLVVGKAGSGKTTFLRDLCRIIGDRRRTALVDERGEIAACIQGEPQNDVGMMTDVLDGYPRGAGILTALRVLSPAYIICDEIGTPEDGEAILQAQGCGCSFAASCHGSTPEDMHRRPVMEALLRAGVFQYCVVLGSCGQVTAVRRFAQ